MIYVALLRGINVGGNNKVDMKKLKATFESFGFSNVSTYINSGNIIFEDKAHQQNVLVNKIEEAIKRDFLLDIKVLVKSLENITTICNELPATWVKNDVMRTDVMFLWDEFNNAETIKLLQIKPVDHVKYIAGAIFWNIEDKDYNNSGMSKLIGTKLYKHMTIRNVNTVRKLYDIMTAINS